MNRDIYLARYLKVTGGKKRCKQALGLIGSFYKGSPALNFEAYEFVNMFVRNLILYGFRISLGTIVCFLTGCATVRVSRADHWNPKTKPPRSWEAPNDAYTTPVGATTPERKTIWVLAWGFNQKNVDTPNCATGNLAEVKVSTNLAFACISILSLGFVQPVTIEWRCAKEPPLIHSDF